MPTDVAEFGRRVASTLSAALGDELIGAWFVGSIALDGFVERESDVDITAVCRHRLTTERRAVLGADLLATVERCPARGLELTLYRAEVVAARPSELDFELNANGGPRMDRVVRVAPDGLDAFWWVIDRAVAHRRGIAIVGAPAADVFVDVDRRLLLDSMVQSMRWHREHERATLYSVLNACRAWQFADEDGLVSKLDGAAWAKVRWQDPSLIDAALALRFGRRAALDIGGVDALLDHVEAVLERARAAC